MCGAAPSADRDGPAPGAAGASALDGIGVIEAPDLDTAVEIARANPATVQGGSVEVRPVLGSWVRGSETDGGAHGVPSA